MKIIGCLLVILDAYLLHLMQVQEKYKKGKISILEANALVRDWRFSSATTFISAAILITGLILLIIDVGWWAPIYFVGSLIFGGFIRSITGNPLVG